jgi:uncharacterized membrane protein YebE (DUF533 family)
VRRLTIGVGACTEAMGLLVAMAWADGVLDDDEKSGIRAAADTLNLNQELRDRLESFMEKPPPLGDVDIDVMNTRDRDFAYVASAWMARVDDGVDEKEKEMLDKIGMILDIGSDRREELSTLAFELDAPGDGEGWSSSIVTLFKSIVSKVEHEEIEVSFE